MVDKKKTLKETWESRYNRVYVENMELKSKLTDRLFVIIALILLISIVFSVVMIEDVREVKTEICGSLDYKISTNYYPSKGIIQGAIHGYTCCEKEYEHIFNLESNTFEKNQECFYVRI